jgi:hypothetical protein
MAALALQSLLAEADAPILHPRIDLRTGLVASGVLAPQARLETLARTLRSARRAWRAAGFTSPISVPLLGTFDADWLDDVAREAGCGPKSLTFALDEREIVRSGPEFAIALRARGWGVALDADPACPLPFGAAARNLYSELVLDAPSPLDPYLAFDSCVRTPLGRRIHAAKEAGLMVTARSVEDDATASLLALAGFDRAGGPVAEQP